MGVYRQTKIIFEKAKHFLDKLKLVVYYVPEKPLILAYVASPCGLVVILSQQMSDGSEKLV